MAKLSARSKKIIHLRYYEGLTQKEIAEQIGLSQMHVSRLLLSAIKSLNYHQTESNAYCCLGDSFRILRGEFHLTPKQQIEAKRLENRSALTIILGGADTTNWSLELAAKFSNALPSIPINVITGGAFPHATQLSKFADETINVTHWHNAQHVSDIFLASRLVISAGGSTQYELQALYTPTMLLIVADNQFQACMQSYNTGKALVLDTRSGFAIEFRNTLQSPHASIKASCFGFF